MSATAAPAFCAVVPAAGRGRRLGADQPKQYLPLLGQPVIEHTLGRLLAVPGLRRLILVVAAGDQRWRELPSVRAAGDLLEVVTGGAQRCHSVSRGLAALAGECAPDDWVMVHDVARPCCPREDILRLLVQLAGDPVGGLLGCPVTDTIKRVDAGGAVLETVPRQALRQALTPQLFRYGLLAGALRDSLARGVEPTDEAAAIEALGQRPRLVEGSPRNIKITRPGDLELAALYLRQEGVAA